MTPDIATIETINNVLYSQYFSRQLGGKVCVHENIISSTVNTKWAC